jgi:DNA polymerase/3'-5' exonuclease PolX
MRHADALKIARRLMERLGPACERIEIKGSISRLKPDVKDIEIVAKPILKPPRVEFGQKKIFKTPLDAILDELYESKRLVAVANGDKLKKIRIFRESDWNYLITLDLFLVTPPSEWGVEAVIRTGPSDFSTWCVTQRSPKGGALPDGYFVKHNVLWMESQISKEDVPNDPVKAVRVLNAANHLSMPEEIDFLNFLELGWIEPSKRVAKWKR